MSTDARDARGRRGFVYLVGAGPGDPRLLTLRAYELLRSAEIVAHDELISDEILALIPPSAERLAVGRRKGHGATTYRLHPLVMERARAGRTIVRLKAGDPLVFGRGGEEAEELAEAGIGFEIVPGVSAALGAAAYAGIPLTHREHAASVTFATGHRAEGARSTAGETVVLYMASRALGEQLAALIARGMAPSTPAAYIAAATTVSQRIVVGTISDLAARVADVATPTGQRSGPGRAGPCELRSPGGAKPRGIDDAPAIVIAGEVVALRERIAWFERQPLRGRRVLVARARPGRSAIAAELRALGAEVLEEPEVTIAPTEVALGEGAIDAIAFGCAAGVDAILARGGVLASLPVIAIGAAARSALDRHGVRIDVAIDGACADALAAHAHHVRDRRVLLVAAADGRPVLREELARLGASVEVLAAYRHVMGPADARRPPIDLVVLPSSSAARAVLTGACGAPLHAVPAIAMGPRAEREARACGAIRVMRADEDTVASIVSRAVAALTERVS